MEREIHKRRLNLIWEITQAVIAIVVTISSVAMIFRGMISEMLGNAFFLVIGFYFGRTKPKE
jgi:hypothetical protein